MQVTFTWVVMSGRNENRPILMLVNTAHNMLIFTVAQTLHVYYNFPPTHDPPAHDVCANI